MHLDPVTHAARYYGPIFAAQESQEAAEAAMQADYLILARKCDANALAEFAPMVRDYKCAAGRRYQTLTEVMVESLDTLEGPTLTEAMQLLLNVAYGSDLVNTPAQARALLVRMARTFAYRNAEALE